jgi:hypothetical protein
MRDKELIYIKSILQRISNQNGEIKLALAYVEKDIALRQAARDRKLAKFVPFIFTNRQVEEK